MTVKLVFVGLLLFITFFKCKGYYQLEGEHTFYITPERIKYNSDEKNKEKNQNEIIK